MPKPKGEEKVFALDVNRLDEEFALQAKRMKRYGDRLADAKLRRNTAKVNLKLTKAEVEMELRRNPKSIKLDKITDKVIEACVQLDMRTRKAEEELLQAEHTVDTLDSSVEALRHKKSSIEGEMQLWSMSYFGTPKVKGNAGREAVRQMERNKRPTIKGGDRG
jgi:hypothetical protein